MRRQFTPAIKRELIDFVTKNQLVELSDAEANSDQIILNKLLTTLVYKAAHDGWEAPLCQALRKYIIAIKPAFAGKNLAYFTAQLREQEKTTRNYFASYLSENSDSEEERQFVAKPAAEKQRMLEEAKANQTKAQIDKLTYQVTQTKPRKKKETTKVKRNPKPAKPLAVKGELRLTTSASKMFDMNKRTTIPYSTDAIKKAAVRDLNHLNLLIKRDKCSIEAACQELARAAALRGEATTQFYVAQYRGITHKVSSWTQTSRRAHRRDPDEIGKPQYSAPYMLLQESAYLDIMKPAKNYRPIARHFFKITRR